PQRRDLDEQADDDRSDERAEGGAESAERDAGEDEQQDLLAHRELQVLRQAEHDARQRGDGAAAGPDDADDPVHVDAGRGGQRRVVGDRPGGLAGTGAQQGDADHDEHADLDGHRDEVLRGGEDGTDLDARLGVVLGVRLGLAAEQDEEQVPHEQRHADRDDHRGDDAGAALAELPPEEPVLRVPEPAREDDRDDGGRDDVQAEGDVDEIGEQGSQGDQLTVGEVGQPGGAVDERQAERRQGDDQPQVEPFEGELRGALPERAAAASFGGCGRAVLGLGRQGEQDGGGVARVHRRGPLVVVSSDGHVGRERGGVQGDLVLAWFVDGHFARALGATGDLLNGLSVLGGHHGLDAVHSV